MTTETRTYIVDNGEMYESHDIYFVESNYDFALVLRFLQDECGVTNYGVRGAEVVGVTGEVEWTNPDHETQTALQFAKSYIERDSDLNELMAEFPGLI